MTWLAVWLLGLGVADAAQAVGLRRRGWGLALGLATQAGAAALLLAPTASAWVGVGACAAALAWWRACHARPPDSRRAGLYGAASLAVPAAVGVGCAGLSPPATGAAASWLGSIPLLGIPEAGAARTFLLLALFVANVESANLLVRDVLAASGIWPVLRPVDHQRRLLAPRRLRGGRVLGAMERLLILGFGAGGNLGAAGLVIAAKGLVRFPELSAAARGEGGGPRIDEVTEYFLIGSFASILVALAGVALAG